MQPGSMLPLYSIVRLIQMLPEKRAENGNSPFPTFAGAVRICSQLYGFSALVLQLEFSFLPGGKGGDRGALQMLLDTPSPHPYP